MAKVFNEKSVLNWNKIYEIPEGTMILKEGETNLDMYKILSGHVEMYTGYGTDKEVLIGVLGPGACFGEFGILTGKPAIYTIIAYSKLRIYRITEELMKDFMKDNPDSILQIMKNMAGNMMRMQRQINQLSDELTEVSEIDGELLNLAKENMKEYVLKRVDPGEDKDQDDAENQEDDEDLSGFMRFLTRERFKI